MLTETRIEQLMHRARKEANRLMHEANKADNKVVAAEMLTRAREQHQAMRAYARVLEKDPYDPVTFEVHMAARHRRLFESAEAITPGDSTET